jgi:hypothetical protein
MSRLARVALAVFMSGLAMTSINAQTPTAAPASGLWHLLLLEDDEANIPGHRAAIRLWLPPMQVRAATLMPGSIDGRPFTETSFDGRTLRIRQRPDNWLVMTWNGKRFEGGSVDDKGQPLPGARPMKLIPAK